LYCDAGPYRTVGLPARVRARFGGPVASPGDQRRGAGAELFDLGEGDSAVVDVGGLAGLECADPVGIGDRLVA
jgi:hypothetical protein